jgi:HEAT repeat protein
MILDRINQVTQEELAEGVFHLLLSSTADRATHEKMRDRRLIPALVTIIQANGRPEFAEKSLTAQQAEQVLTSAIYLLGEIADPDDEEAVQTILAVLDQDNERICLSAAVALGQIGVLEAAEKVTAFTERMMAQGELGAVSRLIRVMAQIGDEKTRASLQNIVAQGQGSDNKHIKYMVEQAEKSIQEINNRLA